MTIRRHSNNFVTTLSSDITNVATSITLASVTGLPTLSGSDEFRITLYQGSNIEIITSAVNPSGTTISPVTRAQESTTAHAFTAGAVVKLSTTANSLDRKADIADVVLKADTSTSGYSFVVDEDTMTSNSDVKVPTQQSVKAYVDSNYIFKTISVSGQSNVVADSSTDTLTLVAGSGMTITTNASTDTITFVSSGGGGSQTPWTGNIDTAGYSLTNATTSGGVTITTGNTASIIGAPILLSSTTEVQIKGGTTTATGIAFYEGSTNGTAKVTVKAPNDLTGASYILTWPQDDGSASQFLQTDGSGIMSWATVLGVTDGDKGDIVVSSSGTVWTIDTAVVTYAKIQNVSATARILGRNTTGAGSIEELTASTTKTMLSLNLVENTALSTWAGSSSLTTLGTIAANLNMGSHLINAVTDPVSAQDAATKNYVDSVATGLNPKEACNYASTANLTVTYANGVSGVGATLTNAGTQAVLVLDGGSPSVGQRILIKDQTSGLQNGVYDVTNVGSVSTNWVLTRSSDYNTVTAINNSGLIPVISGTVNAGTGWLETANISAIGTTALVFVQFGQTAGIVSVTNGGSGRASATSYAPIVGGTTSTGAHQSTASGSTGQVLQSAGSAAVPTWSTPTYPSSSGTSRKILVSDGTNNVYSTETYAVPGSSKNYLKSDGTNWTSATPDTAPVASTLAAWDTNNNLTVNKLLPGYLSTASSAGTLTLTVASAQTQVITGTTTHTIVLPVVSTLALGHPTEIINLSTGVVTVQSSGTNTVQAMAAKTRLIVKSNATAGTNASVWDVTNYTSAASDITGSGSLVRANSPTFVTPALGVATGTSFNTITGVATQAEQESASSTVQVVTPGRQHFHPSACKAWAKFGVSGNIIASYNVSSISDNGAGNATVNFTTSFSSANYGVSAIPESTGVFLPFMFIVNSSPAAGSCNFITTNSAGTPTDVAALYACFFGDQ